MSTRKTSRSKKKDATKAEMKAVVVKTKAEAEIKKAKAKKAGGEKKPRRISALDAAAKVLAKAEKPLRAQELIAAMAEQGLWKSPGGMTPHATLYAAMIREAQDKGNASRFRKVGRGLFSSNKVEADR